MVFEISNLQTLITILLLEAMVRFTVIKCGKIDNNIINELIYFLSVPTSCNFG